MQILIPCVFAAFFVLTGNASAQAAASNPAQVMREFKQSIDRAKQSMSRCWRPDKSFQGALHFRLTVDESGEVTQISRHGRKPEAAIERMATSAIRSCQPYRIPASFPRWNSLDVRLTSRVYLSSNAVMTPPVSGRTLSNDDIAQVRAQVSTCMKRSDFDNVSDTEIEIHLNRNGTLAPGTRILSAPTPQTGRMILEATFRCQPYSLPAERYDGWKAMLLVFMANGHR